MKTFFLSLFIAFLMSGFAQSYTYSVTNTQSEAFKMTGCKDGSILLTAMRSDTIPMGNVVLKIKPNGDPLFCKRLIPFKLRETSTANIFGTVAPGSTVYFYNKDMDVRWYLSLADLAQNPTDNSPIINDMLELEPNRFLISATGFNASYARSSTFFLTVDTLGAILDVKTAAFTEYLYFIANSGSSVYCYSSDKLFKYNMASNLIEPLFRSDTTLTYNQLSFGKGLLLPEKKMIMGGNIKLTRNATTVQSMITCFDSTGIYLWGKAISGSSGNSQIRDLCFASNANDILVTCSGSPENFYFRSDSLGSFHDIVKTSSLLIGGLYLNNQASFCKWPLGLSIMDTNGFIGCSSPGTFSTTIPQLTNGGGNAITVSPLSYTTPVLTMQPEPSYNVTRSNECGTTTGISEANPGSTDLILFPNPASSVLNITHTSGAQDISLVEILNYAGQLIFASTEVENIDIARLPAGYYLAKIHTATGIYSKHFIKD